jgi:hypothetical protein
MTETARDPYGAVDFMLQNASAYAQAKGQRVYIENFLRSKKSLLMAKSDAKTVADREAYAYAHPEYIELVSGLRSAVEQEEGIKWKLTAAQASVEIWRTQEASNRAQDRATR